MKKSQIPYLQKMTIFNGDRTEQFYKPVQYATLRTLLSGPYQHKRPNPYLQKMSPYLEKIEEIVLNNTGSHAMYGTLCDISR